MDLVTTHTNADFDALSSLVAASKLYPGARLLLPGSREKAVRDFLSLIKDKIHVESDKTCVMEDVDRLIIVDNRHKSRIGISSSLLRKKGIKVHIYDHHPRTAGDIRGDVDVFKEVGATVSILLEILEEKGKLDLTPLEATLMLIGIYEETGSLSYSTTTKLDVDMVSRLLDMGANLNVVSSYLNRNLDGNELTALIELLGSTDVVNVNGVNAAFSLVDSERLDGEMGTVVHKLQDVENYPVLFAMFVSGEKVKILARSRIEMIDVNRLLSNFNGAGHSSAASARVTGRDPDEIKGEIVSLLGGVLQPEVFAKDIMTEEVETFSQDELVADVKARLEEKGYEGAPVVDDKGHLAGMITQSDLKKAVNRGMGHSRIKGYMAVNLKTASPDTSLLELKEMMMSEGIGRVPVIDKGRMTGIVTRTDVLKKVHGVLFEDKASSGAAHMDLAPRMRDLLPAKLLEFIKFIGEEADSSGINAFLVGGFVRDLLLGKKKNYDLDVVVEGDAIGFGRSIADKIGAALVIHRKFGTCTVVRDWPRWLGKALHPDNKFKIDIATAREETYESPAALPTVKFSSLREDLYRRDFTINAMAVNINKKNFGFFLDFFGGRTDLKNGTVRVLHDKSFIDDPTRIFRAVRFEQRFGFVIEGHTEYLIKHAVKQEMFKRTENQRIRDELKLMLQEEDPEKAVFRMKSLHELRFIHPELVLRRSIKRYFREIRKAVEWYRKEASNPRKLDRWIMYLILVLDSLTGKQLEEVLDKFVFTRGERIRLRSSKGRARRALKRFSSRGKMSPSLVYRLLEPLSHETVLCMLAKTRSVPARKRIRKFLSEYNGTRLAIRGQDIKEMGIEPGPEYNDLLKKVLYAKIDGNLDGKKEEMRYLGQLVKKNPS
ncbi:MAG: CBS domain-containing protein [Candidatus Omnitrophica bacterium]|nr:CBS domain-containing protein [Candidatus Omnitrophota bacterium]